jgi:hypothetical protein
MLQNWLGRSGTYAISPARTCDPRSTELLLIGAGLQPRFVRVHDRRR